MAFRVGDRSIIIGPGLPILIDSLNSENHSSVVRYTRFPVESGRFKSDHAQDQPEEVELNILITDTPLQDGVVSFQGRHRLIYAQLRIWQKLKVSLILVLGLRTYINMHLEELNISKQPNNGKSINASLKFIEVQETDIGLSALVLQSLVDPSIAYSTGLVPIGIV